MSEQSPYEQLGVTEEASFEEIQEAKQRLLQQYKDDSKVLETIETAYDAVIMDRLKLRQEGKIKVPDRIRFPERLSPTPVETKPLPVSQPPNWLGQFIDTPSAADIGLPASIFALLAGLSLFMSDPQGTLLPLLLALGVFANIYLLNRKERRFGRSVLLTLVGLVLGIAVGTGLATGLRADLGNVPLNSQQICAIVTFVLYWVMSSFLR